MAGATTEHAQVVDKAVLSFLQGQLSVFAKLVGDGCGVSGGRLRFVGLLVFVELVVLVAVVRLVAARSLIFLVICYLCCQVCCHCCQTCSFWHGIFHGGVPSDGSQCDAQGFLFW